MIFFFVLAALLIASAVFVVSAKKPVYSVVGLLGNFIALAMMYLTLQAEFLAVMQIVVYSGAILILFVFVIALLSSGVRPFDVGPDRMSKATLPVAIVLSLIALVAIVATAFHNTIAPAAVTGAVGLQPDDNSQQAIVSFGSVADFGTSLFTTNLLPFEATAFVLMVAIIGVVLIAGDEDAARPPVKSRRKRANERESIEKAANSAALAQGALRQAQGDN